MQLGVHPHVLAVLHVSGAAQAWPAQHACPLPPHAPQLALPHACPLAHAVHTVPPWPHALALVPLSHVEPEQQPEHDVGSQAHTPLAQRCPVAHEPAAQTPPHVSLAPHALPVQSGVQPHTPACPPPPQESGAPHALPAQHGCPLPPQMPQSVPQVCPAPHAAHCTPP